jgi:hypothetical protein
MLTLILVPNAAVQPSDLLNEMVGVNTHVRYTDTAYWSGKLSAAENESLVSLLKDLGVRRVRDSTSLGLSAKLIDEVHTHHDRECRADLFAVGGHSRSWHSSVVDSWSRYKSTNHKCHESAEAGLIAGFEGVNEPNLNAGVDPAHSVQVQWYDAIRADHYFDKIPFIAPSMTTAAALAQYFNAATHPRSKTTSEGSNVHYYIS